MNCRLPLLGRVDGWRGDGWRGDGWRGEEKRGEGRVRAKRVGKGREERMVVGRIERREGAKRVTGERLIGSVGWREEERVEGVVMEDGGDDQNSF